MIKLKKIIFLLFCFLSILSFSQDFSYENQILTLVNRERKIYNLPPVTLNKKLNQLARIKAKDMDTYNYFSHTSQKLGNLSTFLKQNKIKYMIAGENIAKGQKTSEHVFNMWMESKGHRKNILNPRFREMGIGKDPSNKNIWVQEFIGE